MTAQTITQIQAANNLGNLAKGDYFVANRGAGNTGGVTYSPPVITLNVKDYGAIGNGLADDTAAIQATIGAANILPNGANIYFPPGTYIVSASINFPTTGSTLLKVSGDGDSSVIQRASTFLSGSLFIAATTSNKLEICGLKFVNSYAVTSGASIHINNRSFVNIHDITIWDGWDGILIDGTESTSIIIDSISCYQASNIQYNSIITINGHVANILINNSILSAQNGLTLGTQITYGIRILGCDGIQVSNCFIAAKTGISVEGNNGNTLNFLYVNNCIVDGCANTGVQLIGVSTANVYDMIRFEGCHIVPGVQTTTTKGVIISGSCDNVQFRDCDIGVCNTSGVYLNMPTDAWYSAIPRDISFIGCTIHDTEILGGTVGAIALVANQSGVRIQNCYIGDSSSTVYSNIGIGLAGANSNVTIIGNTIKAASSTISFGETLNNTNYPGLIVVGNNGYADRLLQSTIYDTNGNIGGSITATPNAVNYPVLYNAATGNAAEFRVAGSDTNVSINFRTQGTGAMQLITGALTTPLVIYNGTGSQHNTSFTFANTSNSNVVTFPDSSGTLLYTTGTAANVTTNANLTGPITSVGNATSIASQTGTGSTFAMSVSPTFTGTVVLPSGQALIAPALGTPASGALTNCTSIPVANATGLLPIANGGTNASSVTTAPTASAWAGWDANKNLSANNFIEGYATTATAGSSTTLTIASAALQYFTGTTTQTVVLPVAATLTIPTSFTIVNNSTGVVTVTSSGSNTIVAMAASTILVVTCIGTATTAAAWNYSYGPNASGITGSGSLVLATSPTLVTPNIGTPSSGNISSCTSTSMALTTPVITGFTNASSAAAGVVGETFSTSWTTSGSLSSGSATNLVSMALTAGDWDVWANVTTVPAGTTTTTFFFAAINTSSGSVPAANSIASSGLFAAGPQTSAGQPMSGQVPTQTIKISSTTTYYLNVVASFAVSTMTAAGYMTARRVR
ncbi:Pectate lyase superfamily protein [uncultured Caudovirales phage]|uniref:Pectate lyase superfamily protein n=1 Tax=uncultured Caudovirales phage TaxID=2100421 RepID=A0A6J5KHD6_9CAUD|nr:Pectate lyase superfamily protein [uncultured Caudovirales phage]